MRHQVLVSVLVAVVGLSGVAVDARADEPPVLERREAQKIAEKAYLYGFPMVLGYGAMYASAIDRSSPGFKAPFNQIAHETRVFTPADQVATPSIDSAYSLVWLDLRAEPQVLCTPEVEKSRYYSIELFDLYTYVFGYIGTRATGNAAGCTMVTGPIAAGETPPGIARVIRSDTWLAYALYRTELFDAADIDNVKRIQAGFTVQPISGFLKRQPPPPAAEVEFPKFDPPQAIETDLYKYLGFLLQLCPRPKGERSLRVRFGKIGLEANQPFTFDKISREEAAPAVEKAYEKIEKAVELISPEVNGWSLGARSLARAPSSQSWLARAAAAMVGLYGDSPVDALALAAFNDDDDAPLDASQHDYKLTFPKDQLPPVDAYWSITMYDSKTKGLVANPIGRYLLSSRALSKLERDANGALTIHLRKTSPGKKKEANWLPAPDGQFYVVLRLYWPKLSMLDDGWVPPRLERS